MGEKSSPLRQLRKFAKFIKVLFIFIIIIVFHVTILTLSLRVVFKIYYDNRNQFHT